MKRLFLAFAALFFLIAVIGIRINPESINLFMGFFFASIPMLVAVFAINLVSTNKDESL